MPTDQIFTSIGAFHHDVMGLVVTKKGTTSNRWPGEKKKHSLILGWENSGPQSGERGTRLSTLQAHSPLRSPNTLLEHIRKPPDASDPVSRGRKFPVEERMC